MMTLIEEMRLAVLQIWQSLGFEGSSRTAAAVVPALVLGIALNVVALGVVNSVGTGGHAGCPRTRLTSVARTEVKMVRALVTSTLKTICEGQRRICSARQWVLERQAGVARYRSEMSCRWSSRIHSKGMALSIRMERPEGSGHWSRGVERVA